MDNIVPSSSLEMLNYVSVITLCLFFVQVGMNFLRGFLIVKLEQNIDVPIMLEYYNHALILPMDEATSILDCITEKTIENTINKFSENMTTIIIAHRLSTIKDCDKIFVFRNGEIVETGNHKDLLNQVGYYYQLWNGQDKNNMWE